MKILINNNGILKLKKDAHLLLNSEYSSEFSKALCMQHNAQVIDIPHMDYECISYLTPYDFEIVDGVYTLVDTFIKKCVLHKELQEIKQWMLDTDYIPNKIVREDWLRTDPRYIEYSQQYNIKHARKHEIEELLNV